MFFARFKSDNKDENEKLNRCVRLCALDATFPRRRPLPWAAHCPTPLFLFSLVHAPGVASVASTPALS